MSRVSKRFKRAFSTLFVATLIALLGGIAFTDLGALLGLYQDGPQVAMAPVGEGS